MEAGVRDPLRQKSSKLFFSPIIGPMTVGPISMSFSWNSTHLRPSASHREKKKKDRVDQLFGVGRSPPGKAPMTPLHGKVFFEKSIFRSTSNSILSVLKWPQVNGDYTIELPTCCWFEPCIACVGQMYMTKCAQLQPDAMNLPWRW